MEDFYAGMLTMPIIPTAPKKEVAVVRKPKTRIVKQILKPMVRTAVRCKQELPDTESQSVRRIDSPQGEEEQYWNNRTVQKDPIPQEETMEAEYYWNGNPVPHQPRTADEGGKTKALQTQAKAAGVPQKPPNVIP